MKTYKGIVNISNEDYHAEKEHLSSSNLKMLLKDPEKFYQEKVLGNREEVSSNTQNAFSEGSYAHSLILEPDLVDKEFTIFSGMRKQGNEWESFKSDASNFGKTILSKAQQLKVNMWVKSFKALPTAVNLIKNGQAELSLFGELQGVPVKVRADYINIEDGYIADIKTTSGPSDVDNFRLTVESFEYDLSAALYCSMFELHYGRPFSFYFIVLGKRDLNCEVFKLSNANMTMGKQKIIKALNIYKKCKESGVWKKIEKKDDKKLDDYEILEV